MNATPSAPLARTQSPLSEQELLELESKYCSWGDTVHYAEKLDIFTRSAGNCSSVVAVRLGSWRHIGQSAAGASEAEPKARQRQILAKGQLGFMRGRNCRGIPGR